MAQKFKFVYIPADRHAPLLSALCSWVSCCAALLLRRVVRSSQPMEELEQEIIPGKEVECLTNRLQAHFRLVRRRLLGASFACRRCADASPRRAGTPRRGLRARPRRGKRAAACCSSTCVPAQALSYAPSHAPAAAQMKGVEVTDEMMDAVSGMQLVESVTLLPGNMSNGFTCAPGRPFSPP